MLRMHKSCTCSLVCLICFNWWTTRNKLNIQLSPFTYLRKNKHLSFMFFGTLMCILALFSKLSVVCLVLSGPKGTSFFNCSKYSRSLARLQTHEQRVSKQTSNSRKVRLHLHTDRQELIHKAPKARKRFCCDFMSFTWTGKHEVTECYMIRGDSLQV